MFTILTHESDKPPYDEFTLNMLIGYCYTAAQVLDLLICVHTVASRDKTAETFHNYAVLMDTPRYRKTLIDNTMMLKSTPQEQIKREIMIIICHGVRSTANACSYLRFCDNAAHIHIRNDPLNISACQRLRISDVTLKDVIKDSKLVFLSCCACHDIVPEYLTEAAAGGPDILFFDSHEMIQTTHHILFEWLFNLVESDNEPAKDYTSRVKRSIMKMMSIVKMFENDEASFWKFMRTIGMVSEAQDVKTRQQLPCPPAYHNFKKCDLLRYDGDFVYFTAHDNSTHAHTLLNDFSNLCLVTYDNSDSAYTYHRPSNAQDVQFSVDPDVDVFLKEHQRKLDQSTDTHSTSEDSDDDTAQRVHGMRIADPYSSSEDSGDTTGNSDSSDAY